MYWRPSRIMTSAFKNTEPKTNIRANAATTPFSKLATFAAASLPASILLPDEVSFSTVVQKFQNARIVSTDHACLFEDLSPLLI